MESGTETREEPQTGPGSRAAIIVFSDDLDKLLAAFTIATGAAAMGVKVSMFFAFWGLAALKQRTVYRGKSLVAKMLTAMLPSGPEGVNPSRFAFLGLGRRPFRALMRRRGMMQLKEQIKLAREMGVSMTVCESSMGVMGIERSELTEGVEFGGVTGFLCSALESRLTLFI
jgi:peroxiredoxin family protein